MHKLASTPITLECFEIDDFEENLEYFQGNTTGMLADLIIEQLEFLRQKYNETKDIRIHSEEFCKQYPVVLSTTFSARTAIPDQVYDYIIMDEASQVSIETGTCISANLSKIPLESTSSPNSCDSVNSHSKYFASKLLALKYF